MRPRRPLGLSAAALALLAAGCAAEDPAAGAPPSLGSAGLPLVEVSPEQDLDPPVLGSAWGAQGSAQVAFDGTQYLVVWKDDRSGFDQRIFAARVDAGGVVLDPYGIEIGRGSAPTVAAGGGVFLVAYQTSYNTPPWQGSGPNDVRAARIDAQGTLLDAGGGFAISAGAQEELWPSVAFDGQRFLVAWKDGRDSPSYGVYHARVSPAGTVLDIGGVLTALSAGSADAPGPAVAASDQGFLVAWTNGHTHGTRVDAQGVTLDPAGIPLGPAPAPGERQKDLTATFDGTNYVVAWVRTGASFTVNELLAGRVSPQGAALDAAPIVVAPDNGTFLLGASAAADGMGTVLLWSGGFGETSNSVYRARVDPQGAVQPPGGLVLATGASSPALAAAANGAALAVWADSNSDFDAVFNPRLAGSRLDAQGALLDDPSATIATSANSQRFPSVSFDGGQFVVVWEDDRSYDVGEGRRDVHGLRIAPGGAPLDPAGIPIGVGQGHQFLPAAVHTGQSTLVTWSDLSYYDSDDESFPALHAARLSGQGAVLDPTPLMPGAIVLGRVSAASNGAGALLGIPSYDWASVLPVDAAGAPGTESFLPAADPSGFLFRDIATASDGVGYLVAAAEIDSNAVHTVEGWLFDGQGAFTGVGPFPITPPGAERRPWAAAFNGTDYLVLWSSTEGLSGTWVSPDGAVPDPQGFLIAPGVDGDEVAAALACEGERCIAAWRRRAVADDPSSLDLVGAEITPQDGVSSIFAISEEPGAEGPPALAAGAGLVAVTYSRMRQGAPFASVRAQVRWIEPVQGGGGAGGAGTGGVGGEAAGGAGGDGGSGGTPEDPVVIPGCDCVTAPRLMTRAPAAPSWMALAGLGLWRLRRAARRRVPSRPRA